MPPKKTKDKTNDTKINTQPSGEPPEKKYTIQEGCDNARSDARHDFHGIFKAEQIQPYVSQNIPKGLCAEGASVKDEDKFIESYLIKDGKLKNMQNLFFQGSTNDENNETIFNKSVVERYKIINVVREQHNNDVKKSLIQEELNNVGVVDDIFIVCDVAYANVREDLTFVDRTKDQTFYWVQNNQTLYDPAGKTAWHTGAEYGFKDNESRFLFCWEDINKKAITYYPEWNIADSVVDCNDQEKMNKIIFTNKDIYLMTKGDAGNLNDYTKHDAVLIITDPKKPGYYAFADKDYAAKGSGILNKSQMLSYRDKGNSLKRFVKILQTENQVFLDEVMDYSPTTQVLAKKIGDASQSLSTNKKFFYLQKFKDQTKGTKEGVVEFVSNGNHAFVSFDRIAIATAINYNAPIVIQNSQEGMIIYIRNDLITIENQLKKALAPLPEIPEYNYSELVAKINTFVGNFNTIKTNLSNTTIPTNDDEYRTLLAKYFIVVPLFLLIKGINPNILKNTTSTIDESTIKTIFLNTYIKTKNITEYKTKLAEDLNKQISRNIEGVDETLQRDIVKQGNDIQKQYSKVKAYYKDLLDCEILISEINKIYDDITVEFAQNTIIELYKKIPKKIVDNIKSCNPFTNASRTTSEPRNHDAFIERSTQYFGTNTIIIPIFNSLEINLDKEIQNSFVDKINKSIQKIKKMGEDNHNVCFLKLIDITNENLDILNTVKTNIIVNELSEREMKKIIDKQKEIETAIENNEKTIVENKEELNKLDEKQNLSTKRVLNQKNIDLENEIKEQSEELKIENLKLNDYNDLFNKHNLLIPAKKISDLPSILPDVILALKNDRTTENKLKDIISNLITNPSSKVNAIVDEHTEPANEIEIFLKGFLGIMLFMRNYQQQGKKVPSILKKGQGSQRSSQDVVITNFITIAEKLLFKSDEEDKNILDTELNIGDNVIYTVDNQTYAICRIRSENEFDIRMGRNKITNVSRDKITKQNITENTVKILEEDKVENNKNYGDNDYDENAFKKLIEINSISFDNKQLTGALAGYNANQFNFNKVLLMYLEDRITTMNDISVSNRKRPPSNQVVFHDLFKQLFSHSGISITLGGGDSDNISIQLPDIVSQIIDCFLNETGVIKPSNITTFKKNINFMLNAPTITEISTIILHKNNIQVNENFINIFKRAHPGIDNDIWKMYNQVKNKFKPTELNDQLNKIVLKSGPGMITKENIIPYVKPEPVKVNVGGSKTRRHHKISRNQRIKKNKSIRQNRKTRKS